MNTNKYISNTMRILGTSSFALTEREREREREREFNLTFVSLYDLDSGDDKKLRRENKWKNYLCENNNKENIEPIDYFYPRRINYSGNDRTHLGGIEGKYTYSRLFIRYKKGENKYEN